MLSELQILVKARNSTRQRKDRERLGTNPGIYCKRVWLCRIASSKTLICQNPTLARHVSSSCILTRFGFLGVTLSILRSVIGYCCVIVE
jgi:hypothetical protein